MYIASKALDINLSLAIKKMKRGQGWVALLEGPPGGGKTSLASEFAQRIGAQIFRYDCAKDSNRGLLYEPNVHAIVTREGETWQVGPAWSAFAFSHNGNAVLLIDEADKSDEDFDAFLLRLTDEFAFTSPYGEVVYGRPENIAIIITSNGKRKFRPELLRRCQRLHISYPATELQTDIIKSICRPYGVDLPKGLIACLIKIGTAIGQTVSPELRPSMKELAYLGMDCMELSEQTADKSAYSAVAPTYLFKGDAVVIGFDFAAALKTESER